MLNNLFIRYCYLLIVSSLSANGASAQIAIDWVTVGNAGNAPDPITGFGAVSYEYRIGRYEVTNAQYAAFLNSVAASDPNGLYNTRMGSDPRGGIIRSGTDGAYTYMVKPNMGNQPVNWVSWYDAARMCNWMTNGQGVGGTESGIYTLAGPTTVTAINGNLSNPKQVFIPNEDEWYKAAYHQPFSQGGDVDDYWLYAIRSNSAPIPVAATIIGDVASPAQNRVNFNLGADWNGQNGNVTTVGSTGSSSFYGASDMNGNVWEWNETPIGNSRGLRGGCWDNFELNLRSTHRNFGSPSNEFDGVDGFRLASPLPSISPGRCNPADVACGNGTPRRLSPGCVNSMSGPDEGDYNAFFAADGFFYQAGQGPTAVGWTCDIACDDGEALLNNPNCTNNGVNEGDFNCFFNHLFLPCN